MTGQSYEMTLLSRLIIFQLNSLKNRGIKLKKKNNQCDAKKMLALLLAIYYFGNDTDE